MNLQRWIKVGRFSRQVRKAAKKQFAQGQLEEQQYVLLMDTSYDRHSMNRALKQMEGNPEALGAIDWDKIKEWIQENWLLVLRTVISIGLLLLDDEES